MDKLNALQAYNKALAVVVVGIIVAVAAHFGFHLPADVQAALVTLVTAVAVWAVPNK